jgi:hypothetical protein
MLSPGRSLTRRQFIAHTAAIGGAIGLKVLRAAEPEPLSPVRKASRQEQAGATPVVEDLLVQPAGVAPAPLTVRGNRIVTLDGEPVLLKGMNLCDPVQLVKDGRWSESYFRRAAAWGARLLRVPVHPGNYREFGPQRCLVLLDQAVRWSKTYGMYVIVDWHSIGNPVGRVFFDPSEVYRTDAQETKAFWKSVAMRYRSEPTVAFYELFNEPAAIDWKGGHLEWAQWKDTADEIIDVIYTAHPKAIPIVGGVGFASDLRAVRQAPLRNRGVVFAAHPYPGNVPQPWEQNWESYFGYLAQQHPLILTEFGFDPHDTIQPQAYRADADYGRRILAFAKSNNISWTAFVFYRGRDWPMPLFEDWKSFAPTESGALFKQAMIGERSK